MAVSPHRNIQRVAENEEKKFAVASGNKLLIIRHRFEDYLDWCCDNNIPVGELVDDEKDSD